MEWVRLTLDHTLTSRKFPCNYVHCKAPYSCQLHTTSFLDINLVPRDPKGLAKRNGIFKFKRAHHFPTHMLISYLKTVIPETLDSYKNGKILLRKPRIILLFHALRIQLSNCQVVCQCADLQSCLTLCDPMDCSPPGSPIHGILQARILEWVAILSCR